MEQKLQARYGLFMAISMVIGQVIGSGIFFKVDDVLLATQGDVFAGLLGFLIVGISVVFAAASMANYAQLSPKDGGILTYVAYRFGERAAAYVGWVFFIMFLPVIASVLLTVSGIYIAHFLAEFISFELNFLHYSLIGLSNGLLFLGVNIFYPKSSGVFQQLTATLKLIPLILISALGIIGFLGGDAESITTAARPLAEVNNETSFWVVVAASFVPIAFSMDGWYIATQISGEVKNSEKNLPKALILGTVIVLLVYVFYYLGIVSELSAQQILSLKDGYITEFARKLGSDQGALLMQLFIIISVLGTCNGLVLANTRVPYQFYNLKYAKKFLNLNKIHEKTQTPINSALVGFGLVVFYLVIFYATNVLPFFTERDYDISAIPITFIYIVNLSLFLGLIHIFRTQKVKGNSFFKYIMLVFAILGTGLVIIGTLFAPNGFSYLVIAGLFLALGKFFVK